MQSSVRWLEGEGERRPTRRGRGRKAKRGRWGILYDCLTGWKAGRVVYLPYFTSGGYISVSYWWKFTIWCIHTRIMYTAPGFPGHVPTHSSQPRYIYYSSELSNYHVHTVHTVHGGYCILYTYSNIAASLPTGLGVLDDMTQAVITVFDIQLYSIISRTCQKYVSVSMCCTSITM